MEPDQCCRRLVARFRCGIPTLVDAHQHGEIALRSDPDVGIVHGVVPGMIQHEAATPVLFDDNPPQSVISAEGRRMQGLVGRGLEQRRPAPRAPELVGHELRPILDRAMHTPGRPQGRRVVGRGAIDGYRPAAVQMTPRLVDLAGRTRAAETGARHLQGLEDPLLYRLLPRKFWGLSPKFPVP